jgi:hypothetical protein
MAIEVFKNHIPEEKECLMVSEIVQLSHKNNLIKQIPKGFNQLLGLEIWRSITSDPDNSPFLKVSNGCYKLKKEFIIKNIETKENTGI